MRALWLVMILVACGTDESPRAALEGPHLRHEIRTNSVRKLTAQDQPTLGRRERQTRVTGTGAVVDGLRARLARDPIAVQGYVVVEIVEGPVTLPARGSVTYRLSMLALFWHDGKVTRLDGPFSVSIDFADRTPAQIGNELGEAVGEELAAEHVPGIVYTQ
jgi:hypothetical protein